MSEDAKCHFIVELDTGEQYKMRYDAVRCYADKEDPTTSKVSLPEEPPVVSNATRSGKRRRSNKPGQAVPKAKKSKKSTHEVTVQLPKASIKSKSKNCPAIKSSTNRHSSLDLSFGIGYNLYDHPSISSPEPNFDNGLNSSEVKIVCLKQTCKRSFFDDNFPGRALRVEKSLNDDKPPERMITFVSYEQL